MKPLLVIDYSVDGLSGGTIAGRLPGPSEVARVLPGAPFPAVDPAGFSGIVHSGSALSITHPESFTGGACALVRRAAELRVPQMGICYGHQLICLALLGSGAVERASNGPEIGWLPVEMVPPGIAGALPREVVWHSHYDRVNRIPDGARVVAGSPHTTIQAFLDPVRRILGTQFHPEFDAGSGNAQFKRDGELFRKHGVDLGQTLRSAPERDAGAVFLGYFYEMTRGER